MSIISQTAHRAALLTARELKQDIARHLRMAAETRLAAMESSRTGKPVGFYGPELHKKSARELLADVRQRRAILAARAVTPGLFEMRTLSKCG